MPTAFTAEATGLNGRPKRVEVDGGGTSVVADRQLVVYDRGETNRSALDPTSVTTASIHLREDADFTGLVGQGDRAVPVQIYDTTGGTDLLEFQGFLLTDTDHFSDSPYRPADLIKLTAVDGLKTLENDSYTDIGFNAQNTQVFTKALSDLLGTLYDAQSGTFDSVPIEVGTEWYPSGGGLTSTDCPAEFTGFDPETYREERPPEGSTEWWSQYQVLRDVLKTNGFVLRQSVRDDGLIWHVRQRSAIDEDTGTIAVWDVDNSGTVTGPTDRDLELDLSSEKFQVRHSRGYKEERHQVATVHDHTGYKDIAVNSGFEQPILPIISADTTNDEFGVSGDWSGFFTSGDRIDVQGPSGNTGVYDVTGVTTDTTGGVTTTGIAVSQSVTDSNVTADDFLGKVPHGWNIINNSLDDANARVAKHANWSNKPPTQKNKLAFLINHSGDGSYSGSINRVLAKQDLPALNPPEGSYGQLRLAFELAPFTRPLIRLVFNGSYYLVTQEVSAVSDALSGEGTLVVDPVPTPIPSGTVLSIAGGNNSITLSSSVEQGGEFLVGDIANRVEAGDTIRYAGFQPSAGFINASGYTNMGDTHQTKDFRFSWTATDGTEISGDPSIQIGAELRTATVAGYDWSDDDIVLDEIQLSVQEGGSVLDQTNVTASVTGGTLNEEITSRVKSGPSTTSLSRVRGVDPSGNDYEPTEWGIGAGHSSTLTLGELHARERLRYWRGQNEKLQLTLTPRDQAPQIHGDELIQWGGLVLHNELDGDADSLVGPDGTINGDPQPTVGVSGGAGEALDFDGTGDFIQIPHDTSLAGMSSLSISGWLNLDDIGKRGGILSKWGVTGTSEEWVFDHNPQGDLRFIVKLDGTNNILAAADVLSVNTWHHCVAVWDGTQMLIYVDGVQVASQAASGTLNDGTEDLAIGLNAGSTGSPKTDGVIDEPRIYDRALGAEEVQELYESPLSPGGTLEEESKQYTVAHAQSRPMAGEIDLTLIEYADGGTTGISLDTVAELSEEGAAGAGGGTARAIGGGVGAPDRFDVRITDNQSASAKQSLVDDAGAGSLILITAGDAPLSLDNKITWYDNQKIFLDTDVDATVIPFDFSGLTGVELHANGHELDGQDRATGPHRAVWIDSASTDCHVVGTLKMRRFSRQGVHCQGTECTFGTLVGVNIGDWENNNVFGDVLNYGSSSQATDCHANVVIGDTPSRHVVTWGEKNPKRCNVGHIYSTDPGGSHFDMEPATECSVTFCYGSGARKAIDIDDASNGITVATRYEGFPEIGILGVTSPASTDNTFGTLITESPTGGTTDGEALGFGNNCNRNHIRKFVSRGSTGSAVIFGIGAGEAKGNVIETINIDGAGGRGIYYRNAPKCRVNDGVVKSCDLEGVRFNAATTVTQKMFLGPVELLNNAQTKTDEQAAVLVRNSNLSTPTDIELNGTTARDTQSTATQLEGITTIHPAIRLMATGVDMSGVQTPYQLADPAAIIGGSNTPALNSTRRQIEWTTPADTPTALLLLEWDGDAGPARLNGRFYMSRALTSDTKNTYIIDVNAGIGGSGARSASMSVQAHSVGIGQPYLATVDYNSKTWLSIVFEGTSLFVYPDFVILYDGIAINENLQTVETANVTNKSRYTNESQNFRSYDSRIGIGNTGAPNHMLDLDGSFFLFNGSSDPTSNGEFRRNDSDAKVYSGGDVRNMSYIGRGASVSNGGSLLVENPTNVNYADGITASDDGDESVTVSHENTSSASGQSGAGLTVLQSINLDTYGHVTSIGIGDLAEDIDDRVAGLITGGGAINAVYDDPNNNLSISHADTSTSADVSTSGLNVVGGVVLDDYGHVTAFSTRSLEEAIQDMIAGFLQGAGNISLTYDDPNNTLTISD